MPVWAILLLIEANQSSNVRQLINGRLHNTLATIVIVVVIVILIAARQFYLSSKNLSLG